MAYRLTEPMWQAIVSNDSSYDHQFFYGVRTTGIFCRPSCKSRTPARENVTVFRNSNEALARGFRPCKRCRPDGSHEPEDEWAARIADWLSEHYAEPVTLERLGGTFHASPFHLQRIFKKWAGRTPAAYLLDIRIRKAEELLKAEKGTVSEIAAKTGFAGAAHLSSRFRLATGQTPAQYRDTNRAEGKGNEA